MKALLPTVLLLAFGTSSWCADCAYSNTFKLTKPQAVSGVLEDPIPAALPGLTLELVSNDSVVRHVRTDKEGRFDFGEIAPGRYWIHIQTSGNQWCAPRVKCDSKQCVVGRVKPKAKHSVTVE